MVVGSYERGDRFVTVQKLAELAEFYGVPVSELLPGDSTPAPLAPTPKLVIDLERMNELPKEGRPAGPLHRHHPEPAWRLQRPGAVGPPGRPPVAGRHLRQVPR